MKNILILLGCTALFFVAFSPAKLYFASDDFDSIYSVANKGIISLIQSSYRPFTDVGLWVTYYFKADNAHFYMATNTVLHVLCTFMMYAVAARLFAFFNETRTAKKLSLFTALLFLFYPYHSETIFWMVGRGGSQSTLFALLSLYFFLQKQTKALYVVTGILCFVVGAMSYEAVWILPLIMLIMSLFLAEHKRQKLQQSALYWLALVVCLAVRFYNTNTVIGTPYGSQKVLFFNPLFLLRNCFALVTRAFVPPTRSTLWYFIFCILLFAVMLLCIFLLKNNKNKLLLVVAACFIVSLLPVITFGIDTHDTESERFLYLPSVFVCLLVVQTAFILLKNKFVTALVILMVLCFARLTISYKTYVAAGIVTRATVKAVKLLPTTDSLYCVNIPIQYEGAFMFRNGLINMLNIYKPGTHIIPKSFHEFYSPAQTYFVKQTTTNNRKLDHIDTLTTEKYPTFYWQENGLTVYLK